MADRGTLRRDAHGDRSGGVYDRGRRTTVLVRAGDSYLARATRAPLHRLGLDR